MTQKIINVGNPNQGNGDPLYNAFVKINENFTELYTTDTSTKYHLGDDVQFIDIDPDSGTIVIQSGFDTGMPVYIKGANCSDGGVGGNVVIEAGGPGLPNDGTVGNIELAAQQTTIESNNNMWTFRDDGILELPEGGGIVDSNGDSVLVGADITDFGEGFGLDNSDKIVTNKLYSTNETQPTQHYRLELDTNGVIHLPDQSIINGSTLRGVYGTGDANYTGITIGPDAAHREESWMYVDHTGAYIATQYNTNQKLWQFKNDGSTVFPSGAGFVRGDNGQLKVNDGTTLALDLRDSSGRGFYTNGDGFSLRGNGDNTWKFGTDGALTLPQGEGIFDKAGIDSGLNIRSNNVTNQKSIYLYSYGTDGDGTGAGNIYVNPTNVEIYSSWNNGGTGEYKWTFGTDGTLNLPESVSADNAIIQTTSAINIQVNSNGKVWTFDTTGRTTFPTTTVPQHSYGAVGDKLGMVAFDSDYIYYCTANYVSASGSSFSASSNSGVPGDTKEFVVGGDVDTVTTEWTATGGGIVGTADILNVTIGLSVTFVQFDQSFTVSGPITFTGPSGVQPDIWVRTVWTDTNW